MLGQGNEENPTSIGLGLVSTGQNTHAFSDLQRILGNVVLCLAKAREYLYHLSN